MGHVGRSEEAALCSAVLGSTARVHRAPAPNRQHVWVLGSGYDEGRGGAGLAGRWCRSLLLCTSEGASLSPGCDVSGVVMGYNHNQQDGDAGSTLHNGARSH